MKMREDQVVLSKVHHLCELQQLAQLHMVTVISLGDGPGRLLCNGLPHLLHRRAEHRLRRHALQGDPRHLTGLLDVVILPQPSVHEPIHTLMRPETRQHPGRQVLSGSGGRQARDGLEQQHPEAVHVGLLGHDAGAEVEGVGVSRRAHGGPGGRHGGGEAFAGGAQVAEARSAAAVPAVEEHVGRRHVAVHDGRLPGGGVVEVFQGAGDVVDDAHAVCPGQRGGGAAVETVGERAAGEVLQDQRTPFLCNNQYI
jgi:hypothetical protein